MSLPIVENIAANVLTTLKTIDQGATYNHTLTPIRPRLSDYSDVPAGDLVVMQTQQGETILPPATDTDKRRQTFHLTCWIINSDKSSTTYETKMNQVRADIHKALMVDASRGGNARDTFMLPSSEFNDKETGSGIDVFFEVEYRTLRNDPYTKA